MAEAEAEKPKGKRGRKPGRQPGKVYCHANGNTCGRFPAKGRTTCKAHGGGAKVGSDSPSYKGKNFSRHMPKRLGQLFDEAMLDPDFLNQRRRIAQMSARCEELWVRISAEERAANWAEAKKVWSAMWAANAAYSVASKAGDAAEVSRQAGVMADTKAELETMLGVGAGEQFAWEEFRKALDTTRRLIESERRREVESQQVISMSLVTMLVDRLADIVRRNVTNKAELRTISVEFTRELGQQVGTQIDAGVGAGAG